MARTTTKTPRDALKAIFARLAHIPVTSVAWKGEPDISGGKPPTSLAITGATNAAPIVLTVAQGLVVPDGEEMVVSGVGGNTAANGTWTRVTRVDATHVSLDGSDGTASGAYTSGGTLAPVSAWRWGRLVVTPSTRDYEGNDDYIRADNGDGTFTLETKGRRRFLFGIDYFSFDGTTDELADDVLEAFRSGLWDGPILDAFNDAGCAPITCGAILPLPLSVNGTERSGAHLDFPVALAVSTTGARERGQPTAANDWINEVAGTGTFHGGAVDPETQTLDVTSS